jgi:hypothetical protein
MLSKHFWQSPAWPQLPDDAGWQRERCGAIWLMRSLTWPSISCYRPHSLVRIGQTAARLSGWAADRESEWSQWLKGQKAVERRHEMLTKPLRFQG